MIAICKMNTATVDVGRIKDKGSIIYQQHHERNLIISCWKVMKVEKWCSGNYLPESQLETPQQKTEAGESKDRGVRGGLSPGMLSPGYHHFTIDRLQLQSNAGGGWRLII